MKESTRRSLVAFFCWTFFLSAFCMFNVTCRDFIAYNGNTCMRVNGSCRLKSSFGRPLSLYVSVSVSISLSLSISFDCLFVSSGYLCLFFISLSVCLHPTPQLMHRFLCTERTIRDQLWVSARHFYGTYGNKPVNCTPNLLLPSTPHPLSFHYHHCRSSPPYVGMRKRSSGEVLFLQLHLSWNGIAIPK